MIKSLHQSFRPAHRLAGLLLALTMTLLLAQVQPLSAQTTVSTGLPSSASSLSGANATIVWAIQNTNTYPIIMTDLASYRSSANGAVTWTLWYTPAPLTGSTSITGPIWTSIASISAPAVTTTNIFPLFSGLSFTIPSNTTYRFALVSSGSSINYGGAANVPNINTNGGVSLLTGNYQIAAANVGYSGTSTSVTINPRFFIGSVTFLPATPCTGTPLPPVITTAPLSALCAGTSTSITASNPNQVSGLLFQWQQSASSTGPWSNVTGGSGGTTLSYTTPSMTTTTWYRLKVSCGNSLLDTISAVYQVPVVNPQLSSTTPAARCGTGTVTLSATGNGTGIKWYTALTGGTAVSSSASFTTPSLSATTTYYAVAVNGSCESSPRTAVVATVNTPPTATVSLGSSPVFCTGSALLNANTGTNLTYQWQQNAANITGATASSYSATSTGSYRVIVTNSLTGCSTTSAATAITAGSPPPSPITPAGSTGICQGNSTTLSTPTFPGLSYQWQLNGNTIPGATNATYAATLAGNYTVTVSTSPSCSSTTPTPAVVFYHTPPFAQATSSALTICTGSALTLNASPGNGQTYQWQNNGVNIAGATSTTLNVTAGGNYSVLVKNTATTCVSASNVLSISLVPLPPATIAPSGAVTACDSTLLTANTGSGLSYQWMRNGLPISGATGLQLMALASGNYTVQVRDLNQCTKTSPSIPITVNPSPDGTITYYSPLLFCEGSAVVLNVLHQNAHTFQWYRNGIAIPGASAVSYIAMETGVYSVLTGNNFGCNKSSEVVLVKTLPIPVPVISQLQDTLDAGPYLYYQWFHNQQAIGGANQRFLPLQMNGAYSVTVTDSNGCLGTAAVHFVNGLGTGPSFTHPVKIRVYPNPAQDLVRIESPVPVQIRVRDLQGRILLSVAGTTTIHLGGLPSGIYLMQLIDQEGRLLQTEKLIKTD